MPASAEADDPPSATFEYGFLSANAAHRRCVMAESMRAASEFDVQLVL